MSALADDIKVSDITPSYNLEAEMSALASAVLKATSADIVFERLKSEDFYHPAHRIIFDGLRALWAKAEPIDLVTLKDRLGRGKLQEVGGEDYLIQVLEAVPSASNADHYCQIVRDRRLYRDAHQLIASAKKHLANEDLQVSEQIAAIQDDAMAMGRNLDRGKGPAHISHGLRRLDDELDQGIEGTLPQGLKTGLIDLDEILGGLFGGQMIIIGARPSMGKTGLIVTLGLKMARAGVSGLLFSLEMTERELTRRLVAMLSGVTVKTMKGKMTPADYDRVKGAMEVLYDLPITIDESSGLTVNEILTRARAHKRANPDCAYIMVDYLQIVSEGRTKKGDNRNQAVAAMSAGFKHIAKELDVPVIVLSQLSRTVEGRPTQRPVMSDLRDSGAIEQDADIVVFVHRENKILCDRQSPDADWNPDRNEIADLIVAKNRDGELGTAKVIFTPKYARFSNLAQERLGV